MGASAKFLSYFSFKTYFLEIIDLFDWFQIDIMANNDYDDDYERTLLQLPHVMVFKIPTLKTSGGHRVRLFQAVTLSICLFDWLIV